MLSQTNSGKEKERILKENESAELKEYLNIALNPYRIYYVSKFGKDKLGNKETISVSGKGFTKFKNLIEKLEKREISGHLAYNTIIEVFDSFVDRERTWYKKALCKESINLGVTIANKAFPALIPTFKVMLADNKQPDLDKLVFPLVIQPKLDGFRAVYIPGKGLVGRNGKAIRNTNLPKHFRELYNINDFVFDGELYSDSANFNEIASILNSEDKEIPEHIEFCIFDGMEETDWKQQSCKLGYNDRLSQMYKYMKEIDYVLGNNNITTLSHEEIKDLDTLKERYRGFIEEGFEGAMLKDPNGLYQWKRVRCSSQTMMKLKPEVTFDLKITGFEEGEGKFQKTLGKVLVDYNGVEVGVGSGFTDDERKDIWKNRKKCKGRLVEVKGMEITPDKSIRHPVFIRFRDDK